MGRWAHPTLIGAFLGAVVLVVMGILDFARRQFYLNSAPTCYTSSTL
jgi:hypothetical protein